MVRLIAVIALLAAAPSGAQWPPLSRSLPPQTPVPGAPTTACSFPDIDAQTPIRITAGDGPIPYQFGCGYNRPPGVCAEGVLPAGLIVSLGEIRNGWACVTGGDSTTGWIPAERLDEVPASPRVPISEWLGWWHQENEVKGRKNDRLLITRLPDSKTLHISGRAYWYGLGDNVHFGEFQADAAPIGIYLHVVQASQYGAGCIVDLKLDPATHTLDGYDNMQCGGMNVRFSGTWRRFLQKERPGAAKR